MSRLRASGDEEAFVSFRCPGCGTTHAIPTKGPRAWGFNGDVERPTLTPSILVYGHPMTMPDGSDGTQPRCHSFVTDGRIQFLSDCTHERAGQTLDLPECDPQDPT